MTKRKGCLKITFESLAKLLGMETDDILSVYDCTKGKDSKIDVDPLDDSFILLHKSERYKIFDIAEGQQIPIEMFYGVPELKEQSEITKGYNGFSECEMIAYRNGEKIGDIKYISYSIYKNNKEIPLYPMGSLDPRDFLNTIGGTLTINYLKDSSTIKEPFDVELKAANEYGDIAVMKVQGIEIQEIGSIFENSCEKGRLYEGCTYSAKSIIPWQGEPVEPRKTLGAIHPDDCISAQPFTVVPEGSLIKWKIEENHTGMIYNPVTDKWTFGF
jgi:hypothetical protein